MNLKLPFVKMYGLDPKAIYKIEGQDCSYSGAALMNGGFAFGEMFCAALRGSQLDTFPSAQYHFVKVEE